MSKWTPWLAGRLVATYLSAFFLLASVGCALLPSTPLVATDVSPAVRIDVPFYSQQDFQCGPAALAMLLAWNGETVAMDELVEHVYSPERKGSLQPTIVAAARRHGYLAYPISGKEELTAELMAGHPVLVLQNLGLSWIPRWHYAVVIGRDPSQASLILHTGVYESQLLAEKVFSRTWRRSGDWGLVVLAPGQMPATALEADYIEAVVGLERAGQHLAAAVAYEQAVIKWPDSFVAWMGLGNTWFQMEDVEGSITAFRHAATLRPENAIPLNNLAFALATEGRRSEALEVIDRAVALGGAAAEMAIATRERILLMPPTP